MSKKVTKKELADIFGITERTFTEWQKEGMPIEHKGDVGKENQYDTAKVLKWIRKHDSIKNVTEYDIERTRLTKAQADFKELEVKQLEEILIPADITEETMKAIVSASRVRITGIGTAIKNKYPQLDHKIIKDIEASCKEALKELSTDGLPADLRKNVAKRLKDVGPSS